MRARRDTWVDEKLYAGLPNAVRMCGGRRNPDSWLAAQTELRRGFNSCSTKLLTHRPTNAGGRVNRTGARDGARRGRVGGSG